MSLPLDMKKFKAESYSGPLARKPLKPWQMALGFAFIGLAYGWAGEQDYQNAMARATEREDTGRSYAKTGLGAPSAPSHRIELVPIAGNCRQFVATKQFYNEPWKVRAVCAEAKK